ncbi:polymorphic toxin-type HINT domain-containing protein [Tundrisphaera lichenicola]|uniref:polymorphic toxin-type HINT domain-containing protein n=1 Tax=Tundrisphaera lichenicola TaxID=2029860 RepID=UPI003EC0AFD1
MCLALICAGLMAAISDNPPEVNQAYQEARASAGRSSEDQVRLALWCEAHGLTRERLNHLAVAVLADPQNATARGLMGLVAYQGRFLRPEAVAERSQAEPILAEYDARRARAPYSADGQWSMGLWAEEHGLKDQARAHFTAVTRLDPTREAARMRLGYRRVGGRWVTDAQLAAEKAEAEAQKQADKKWKAVLVRHRNALGVPSKRAEASLLAVTDPRAAASVARVFGGGRAADQEMAVRLFGQIEGPFASKWLAFLAISSSSPAVRRAATETVRLRDPREYLGLLIGLIRDPVKYEVRPVGGPGSPGVLFVEGKKANVRRVYSPPPPPEFLFLAGDFFGFDEDGLPVVRRYGVPMTRVTSTNTATFTPDEYLGRVKVDPDRAKLLDRAHAAPGNTYQDLTTRQDASFAALPQASRVRGGPVTVSDYQAETTQVEITIPVGRMILESQRTAVAAQEQLMEDIRAIEARNDSIRRSNETVRSTLKDAIGQDHGDDREAWDRMWVDRLGYAFRTSTSPVPTIVENVPLGYQPAPIVPTASLNVVGSGSGTSASLPPAHSCFAAGTTVRTIEGDRAIETVRAGDLVLTQDTGTGALTYQPVVAAFHNPPNATLRIGLGEDVVVATGIHRFWKAGKGWVMARDLKAGDPIRTLGGVARVESVEEEQGVQPVFNLEVAEGHSFLVGKLGALVHDNSLVEPVQAPFDAASASLADHSE